MIRKKWSIIAILVLLVMSAHAGSEIFEEDDMNLNIGVGLNPFPVFSAVIDRGIVEGILDDGTLGVGGYAGLGFESGGWRHHFLGARGTFHYPIIDDLDTYLGISAGFCYDVNSSAPNEFWLITGAFLGANYPITDALKVFGEFSYKGIGFVNVGITLSLDEIF